MKSYDYSDVMEMLRPEGGWIMRGDSFEGLTFIYGEPVTKQELEKGYAEYPAWKAAQEAQEEAKKASALAKLAALGLTTEDLTALGLGGN